ncbi:family 78 glycoside hydrolase catalytic domain [Lacibacter sp.]|uniref:family 78 glycoside hydrolase catalytic domain n=1 Tax=Lacibacter sp. TaxID=1915409 RepID=UPI002B4B1689|nr:family 78 glycoside hydrolase catalytic domain [Lacibacter sp.]HLP38246.1 family 78 glycoside hydrolase catalytic domain [Lacibacter sp.]
MKKTILINACFLLCTIFVHAQQLAVTHLRCESRNNPLGVDVTQPKLSWQLQSTQQNVLQTAYRILVADEEALLKKNIGNVWDSKQIKSSASIQVAYSGKELLSAKKYYWKVQVWDNKGNTSTWSVAAYWQMGLLQTKDWSNAKWIGYDEINDTAIIAPHVHLSGKKAWGPRKDILPVLRKEFAVVKKIKQATVFICGLGHFEVSINGKKIGDHFLAPGWTNYSKHAQYVTFDVTKNIQQGKNAIGVMLGNGFYYIPSERYRKMTGAYGYPKLIAKTLIEFMDGTTQQIISDESWKTDQSPIIYSSIFGGEDYDANLFQQGWNEPGFHDAKWKQAIVTQGPALLESQMNEPVKVMQQLPTQTKRELKSGVTLYDLGQNFSGVPSITVKGNKGDTVKLICGELINADGTANQKATGSPSFFTYILKGDGEESWHPLFTYTGFRYVEVHCKAKETNQSLPQVIKLEGLHIRNAAATVGSFSCSNDLFNRTHTLIDWAIKSNMVSVFTDCPHREKLGWLEETHLVGTSVHYKYDVAALNKKVINDMKNAQYANGKIPEIAPEFTVFTPPFDESPEWGSAAIIYSWYNYQWYGDKETLLQSYDMMKAYVLYLKGKAKNNILSHGLGDWFDIGPNKSGFAQMTKMGITATATFYYDLNIMIKIATMLKKNEDVKFYEQLAADVKTAFNQTFFDPIKQQYDSSSQTANAMALYMGLVEEKNRQAVVDALIREIRSRNNALTAGDIGYRYVLQALQQAGRSDVIFDMNYRDDVPGYGYQLKHGATALTESWQAYESVSNNHFMLGHLMEWFYAGLAGIQQAESSIAYKEIVIKPEVVGDVTNVKASFQSPYGLIKSEWVKTTSSFNLRVEIPANSTAVVYLPAKNGQIVLQNGKKTTVVYEKGKAVMKVGSGKYEFSVVSN